MTLRPLQSIRTWTSSTAVADAPVVVAAAATVVVAAVAHSLHNLDCYL